MSVLFGYHDLCIISIYATQSAVTEAKTDLAWSQAETIGNRSRSEKTRRSDSDVQTVLDPAPVTTTTNTTTFLVGW